MPDAYPDASETTHHDVIVTQSPPRTLVGVLGRLGPGLIIAGSIVGSGELIGTTKTGAEAGFWLLWLIIVGCVIKVFVQIEFGRFSITQGRTTMDGMNRLPGPRLRVSWLMWYWLLMFILGIGQLGGIVGGVGQSLALTLPISGDLVELLQIQSDQATYDREQRRRAAQSPSADEAAAGINRGKPADVGGEFESAHDPRPVVPARLKYTWDDVYWSAAVTVITAVLLAMGRYGMIQSVATVLVVAFTAVTVGNLLALQSHPDWAIHFSELGLGLLPLAAIVPGGYVAAVYGASHIRHHRRWGQRADRLSLLVFGKGLRPIHRITRLKRRVGAPGTRLALGDALGRLVVDGGLHVCHDRLLSAGRGRTPPARPQPGRQPDDSHTG